MHGSIPASLHHALRAKFAARAPNPSNLIILLDGRLPKPVAGYATRVSRASLPFRRLLIEDGVVPMLPQRTPPSPREGPWQTKVVSRVQIFHHTRVKTYLQLEIIRYIITRLLRYFLRRLFVGNDFTRQVPPPPHPTLTRALCTHQLLRSVLSPRSLGHQRLLFRPPSTSLSSIPLHHHLLGTTTTTTTTTTTHTLVKI